MDQKEKQIEGMTGTINDMYGVDAMYFGVDSNAIAHRLYDVGYRKQEWISVDERLPDVDGEYLTWDGLIYYLICFNASLGLWNVSDSGNTSTAITDVTHWMPLPKPPIKKGGER